MISQHKIDPENNSQNCTLCGYYKSTQSHQYNQCVFSQLIKKLFLRAYSLDYGITCKPLTKYTYFGSLSKLNFTKQATIDIATLMHTANSILHTAASNQFIITSSEDFLKLVFKSCVRASKVWPKNTFPTYLLEFTKLKEICPFEEMYEIKNIPLSRFIKPNIDNSGLELSKLNELFIEHRKISKIFLDFFKTDINKTEISIDEPKDSSALKIIRGLILDKFPDRLIESVNKDLGIK